MNETLEEIISSVTRWAKPIVEVDNGDNLTDLKSQLLNLYRYCNLITVDFDDNSYADYISKDYNELYATIARNLPELGLYPTLSSVKIEEKYEVLMNDAVEDLSDIILMLYEYEWRLTNNSIEDALWTMKLDFDIHVENHLAGLIFYLSNMK